MTALKHFLMLQILFGLLATSVFANRVPKGLVAHWKLDGNANDATANNFNGTFNNNPTATTDRFGRPNSAYCFDGTGQYTHLTTDCNNLLRVIF